MCFLNSNSPERYLLGRMNQSGKYYLYILRSKKDDSFYIGHCDDLDRRMSKHFDGMSKYTSGKRPWRLCYFEVFENRSDALRGEREIRNKKSRIYILHLIDNRFI